MRTVLNVFKDERGQDIAEYAVMLAVIRGRAYPASEVLQALTACLAKTIVQASDDDAHIAQMVEVSNRLLRTTADLQTKTGPDQ